MAQTVKRLPTMRETQVQSLAREDLLEKEMATHSNILPGKSHGPRSLVGYSPWGRKESDKTEWLHFHFPLTFLNISVWPLTSVNFITIDKTDDFWPSGKKRSCGKVIRILFFGILSSKIYKYQNNITFISKYIWNVIYLLSTREELKILGCLL